MGLCRQTIGLTPGMMMMGGDRAAKRKGGYVKTALYLVCGGFAAEKGQRPYASTDLNALSPFDGVGCNRDEQRFQSGCWSA